jgi:hypothetical protein
VVPLLASFQDWDPWVGGFGSAQQGQNVAHDLAQQAYRTLRSQGLSEDQAAAVLQHRAGRPSRSGLELWDPTRLQQRPQWSGPPVYSMDTGFGLDADTLQRARKTEQLLVDARSSALQRRQQQLRPGPHIQPGFAETYGGIDLPSAPRPPMANDIGVDHGLGFDVNALAQRQDATPPPQRQGSGGMTTAGDLASIGADLALQTLPLTRPQQAAAAQATPPPPTPQRLAPPHVQPGFAETGGAIDIPNVSGGGPGTSTAKGTANVAKQVARRAAPNGFLQGVDSFITHPAQSIGVASQQGLRDIAAALHRRGMPSVAGMAKNLAPVARWAAPAAAFGAAVGLPVITGAMEGNETAGAGGAAIQGGATALGAAVGSLIPLPVVGTAIGAMAGNWLGSGLAQGAAGAVEKAQQGDTGLIGNIGRALDPFVDTAFEKEQKAALQQMNSPAMQMIQEQERTRQAEARAQQAQQVLMQSYLRVI